MVKYCLTADEPVVIEVDSVLFQGTNAEIELEAGKGITITTDDAFKEKCTAEMLWVDYKNIVKVVSPGKKVYIDDGLISVIVLQIGAYTNLIYYYALYIPVYTCVLNC